MILELGFLFFVIGMGLAFNDFVIPLTPDTAGFIIMNKFLGGFFIVFSFVLLFARIYQTGVGPLLDLPNTNKVILFHQRRGRNPNTSILLGKLKDLEFIRSKNKLFKDTGGGFRIAGHDCRRTHETICHDIPEWVSQYFHDVRKKFKTKDYDQFIELSKQLSGLRDDVPGMDLEKQLSEIDLLKPLMKDAAKKKELLAMGYDRLKHLEFVFFDGVTHNGEEIEQFIDSATPNELDVLEKQEYLNDSMREKNYSDPGDVNWSKYAQLMGWVILVSAVAFLLLKGAS